MSAQRKAVNASALSSRSSNLLISRPGAKTSCPCHPSQLTTSSPCKTNKEVDNAVIYAMLHPCVTTCNRRKELPSTVPASSRHSVCMHISHHRAMPAPELTLPLQPKGFFPFYSPDRGSFGMQAVPDGCRPVGCQWDDFAMLVRHSAGLTRSFFRLFCSRSFLSLSSSSTTSGGA